MLEPKNFVSYTVKLCEGVKYDNTCFHDKQKKILAMYTDEVLSYYHPDHPSSKILLDNLKGPVQEIIELYFSRKITQKNRTGCCC